MMVQRGRDLLGLALMAALAVGCDTARPGAGFTNGPEPEYSPEKPALRTDLPPPEMPDPDAVAGQAASDPDSGTGTDAGTGGRSGGQGGVEPAEPRPDGSDAPQLAPATEDEPEIRATPPTLEAPAGNSAAGETKPQGNIEVGTPRSPQL